MKDRKGKQALVEPLKTLRAVKWQRHPRVILTFRVGEVSLQATKVSIGKVTKAIERAPRTLVQVLSPPMKLLMAKVGYGTITTIDQAANMVCKAPSKASDGHNENAEDITKSPTKKGKATKRLCLKVMKARHPTPSSMKVPSIETFSLLLEEYVPLECKEELFQETFRTALNNLSMYW